MRIDYSCSHSDEELLQILNLQAANFPEGRSAEVLANEGFVTVKHDLELLREMQAFLPHILAKSGQNLIGYALSMHPALEDRIAVLRSMFAMVKSLKGKDFKDYLVMGQICVAEAYRGSGIFRGLYTKMRATYKGRPIITEVDDKNQRSLHAHKSIGFKTLSRHLDDGHLWHLLIWE